MDGGDRAPSELEDSLRTLANHIVFEEHLVREERPMRAEHKVTVGQVALMDTIAGIPTLIYNAVTALISTEGHNGITWTDNRLQAMLPGLVNKTIEKR